MKRRVREITSRSKGKGDLWRKQTLSNYIRGWTQYFRIADAKSYMQKIDEWMRRRIRMCIWKQWKWIKTKFVSLSKLGTPKRTAWAHANTRKSYWHTAHSYTLSTTITNDRLKQAGCIFFSGIYKSLSTVY
jgi:hypothetical protein